MDEDELASRHYPVEEDMRMQQRVWRFERVGWYALVLVVLLGLAGLFGNGPLIPDPAQRTCRHSRRCCAGPGSAVHFHSAGVTLPGRRNLHGFR
ncbi:MULTISPECIES: hypothetical protein [Pseudomonas]|uniref:hypothetical protein n=1 Tax=Pseudomonas TaxID=286 RepID=UPI000A1DE56D|nr:MULTISPECIES: hypothetical protein [Pseudomonas]QNT43292.1 hypothetical protein ICJ54_12745 [Pseudomonas asiatica]